MREKVTQIQETQRLRSKRNPKKPMARHIIIKMAKFQDKERILKAAREKQEVTYKGAPIGLAAEFSMETLQAKREWQKIFQVMRTTGMQPSLLYPARLSIKMESQKKGPSQTKESIKNINLLHIFSVTHAKGFPLRNRRKTLKERETQEPKKWQ